ncbi:hypothetical protein [Bradyrhizobium sp. SZCCHNS3002]|uniref:hypothetical protein n=1 Tax=Bradyrhizobium sp. SZCCHNS3002 TaxID=3057310 RepID=UPI0028E942BE|nr:hypothetical protein [Bradyrhizobium sp. SZCCHNS3002]
MKRICALMIGASTIAGTIATPANAGGNRGAAVAAGVVGGLAIGALIGSAATARSAPTYVYSYEDYPPPRVVYRGHRVYEYDADYGNYGDGYLSGYRDGYSDGSWDND